MLTFAHGKATDDPVGLLLVLGVGRVRLDGAVPPLLALGTGDLADLGIERLGPVLDGDGPRVGQQVQVPLGVRRRAALGRHQGVRPVVLHPHERRLAELARPPAAGGHDDHR